MPRNRTYPHGAREYIALQRERFAKLFNTSEKVVVYWQLSSADGVETVDIIDYYDSVTAANTAAAANVKASGEYPHVEINQWHSDVTIMTEAGPAGHRDAREDKPSWWDADPAY